MPDLRQLAQAVAVADTGGIAGASRALGLAQPALSRSLREMEARLGCALFERRGSGTRPTAAGDALVEGARTLLAQHRALIDEVRRRAAGETGTLAIGFNETVSWGGVVPEVLRRFRDTHPDVRLMSLPMGSAAARAALAAGDVALAFMFRAADGGRGLRRAADRCRGDHACRASRRPDRGAARTRRLGGAGGCAAHLVRPGGEPRLARPDAGGIAGCGRGGRAGAGDHQHVGHARAGERGCGLHLRPRRGSPPQARRRGAAALDRPDLDQRLELVWRTGDGSALTRRFVDCARAVLHS